jgi:hypothetical protein
MHEPANVKNANVRLKITDFTSDMQIHIFIIELNFKWHTKISNKLAVHKNKYHFLRPAAILSYFQKSMHYAGIEISSTFPCGLTSFIKNSVLSSIMQIISCV